MVKKEEPTKLEGPVGQLEALLTFPQDPSSQTTVIICHPHPLYGGTMSNKVVTTLARTFDEMGYQTVRFNFRGVGKSEGIYGEAIGEIDDLLAVLSWVRQRFPEHKVWLAGFSFGSHITAQVAARDHRIEQLVSIAPPVNHFNFQNTNDVSCPWLVVMGEEDEVVPVEDVRKWLTTAKPPIQSVFLPGVTHFFHGRLVELREVIQAAVVRDQLL
ncbi:MAG: hypothetical protein K0Q74_110 [Gammaproteobacteria bacterium]|jgi:alpha/beta superfamily hydrolase|nr:hypothetical protein [Gammaproteobacteria bacterium]